MFKRELKINLKSFIIWISILLSLFLLIYLVYPMIIVNENKELIDEMLKIFPKELLTMFNMDLSSMESAYGYFKSEGLVFIILIISSYSSILGSSILLKEENDKTIEYLNSLPIKRNDIVISKTI